MNIKETFLKLTRKTYPHGTERKLRGMLPRELQTDKNGNYYLKIGESKTIFACHLDTVSKDEVKVNHVIEGNMIKTDGKSILGADDKAGVVILLYLIHKKIPGTYYFFIGEEVGCIGSKAAVKDDDFSSYERIISFDRRDTCSIITHQSWSRCCSDDFANALSVEYTKLGLELKPDDTGVGTDSAQFTEIIPECTNLSVGYYKEHTHEESQDIEFLEKLCIASANINWEALPTARNPKVKQWKEYKSSNYNYGRNRSDGWGSTNTPYRGNSGVKHSRDYDYDDCSSEYDSYEDFYPRNPAYGYDWDEETPIDNALENDKRRKKDKKSTKRNNPNLIRNYMQNSDVFISFRDYLGDKYISPEDYSIIEEQYIDNWLL
jgi:hypothetical protein